MVSRTGRRLIAALVCSALVAGAFGSAAAATSDQEPVTLKLLTKYEGPAWERIYSNFEAQYPWVTIEAEVVPNETYQQKVGLYAQAGSGPDVMQMDNGAIVASWEDVLEPLNDELADLIDTVSDARTYCKDLDCSKIVWSVPMLGQGHPLYYNKTVLAEAGLDPEDPPRTWREMSEACIKVKAIGKECWALGAKDFHMIVLMAQMPMRTASVEQMEGVGTGETKWTDPAVLDSLRLIEQMVSEGWFSAGLAGMNIAPEAQALFTNGGAAFFQGGFSSPWNFTLISEFMSPDNFGLTNLPTIEKDYPIQGIEPGPLNETLAVGSASGLVVPTWTQHRQEAIDLVRFMVDPETQAILLLEHGGWPTSYLVDTSMIAETPTAAQFNQALELAQESKSTTFLSFTGYEYLTEMNADLQLLALGELSAEDMAAHQEQLAEQTRN